MLCNKRWTGLSDQLIDQPVLRTTCLDEPIVLHLKVIFLENLHCYLHVTEIPVFGGLKITWVGIFLLPIQRISSTCLTMAFYLPQKSIRMLKKKTLSLLSNVRRPQAASFHGVLINDADSLIHCSNASITLITKREESPGSCCNRWRSSQVALMTTGSG